MSCSCCREEKPTAALRSRDDVDLCRDCAEWLLRQVGVGSTPTLPVVDLMASVAFYESAGFGVRLYRDDCAADGGFAFVDYDGQSVFDLTVEPDMDPTSNRSGCYLVTAEAAAWHDRMTAAGLHVTSLDDQPWGMREFTLRDPAGNRVRIGRALGDD